MPERKRYTHEWPAEVTPERMRSVLAPITDCWIVYSSRCWERLPGATVKTRGHRGHKLPVVVVDYLIITVIKTDSGSLATITSFG